MEISKLFFKDVEPSQPKNEAPSAPKQTPAPPTNVAQSDFSAMPQGTSNDRFINMLEQAINDNNIPGADYIEMKSVLEKMSNLPMDEQTKFVSAFIGLESQGCTKEALINSIDKYISVVNNEVQVFNSELATTMQEKVTNKLSEVEEAKAKILSLNEEIMKLNNFILETTQLVQKEEMSLKIASADFNKSALKLIHTMTSDKEKIINYIK